MYELNVTGKLFGEIIALRLTVQRLLAQLASQTGDFEGVLRHEHEAVLDDLRRTKIADDDPQRAQAIRDHAERVLDDMYTTVHLGRPPAA